MQTATELRAAHDGGGGLYTDLFKYVQHYRNEYRNECLVWCEHIALRQQSDALRTRLETIADRSRERLEQVEAKTAHTKDAIQTTRAENRVKCELVEKWEASRVEQAKRIYRQEEAQLDGTIAHFSGLAEREKRASDSTADCLRRQTAELERTCDAWQRRHAADTADLDGQIRAYVDRIEARRAETAELRRLGAEYQAHIDAHLTRQTLRAERRAYEEMLWSRATRIQAWWRGQMVRHKLGPYRPKKGKKKGKK